MTVEALDPGPLFAAAAGAACAEEDRHDFGLARYDLVVAVGTLDTVNDLGPALAAIRRSLRPDSAFIGALAGGDSLAALRRAMLAADRETGPAAARTHPRIAARDAGGAARRGAGFVMPVVDVDRVDLALRRASPRWSRDLRAMGASNMLSRARRAARSPLGRARRRRLRRRGRRRPHRGAHRPAPFPRLERRLTRNVTHAPLTSPAIRFLNDTAPYRRSGPRPEGGWHACYPDNFPSPALGQARCDGD